MGSEFPWDLKPGQKIIHKGAFGIIHSVLLHDGYWHIRTTAGTRLVLNRGVTTSTVYVYPTTPAGSNV